MIRGYDSGQVLREDIIERVRHLCAEIEAGCEEIEQLEKEAADIRCTLSTERNT